MRNLYTENSANFPRLETDTFFADYENTYKYIGFVDDAFKYIEDFQLLDPALWERFVNQFKADSDFDAGWRGEYWGKMMRGASFVYSYTKNQKLYDILTKTVEDMIECADNEGRISTYAQNHEFDGWDMWCRKYVLLGMQYFLEICEDEKLKQKIVNSMCGQVSYIMSKIGKADEGKKPITSATRHWRGLNSSSILEPVVRLYNLTKDKKYFDFAEYIVSVGGTDVVNIFDRAYENEFYPYQYPVTKAYEMTSCFEGLLEFYRVTGIEKYKTALINFADKILETDFTVIGCSGCTHELFDYSTARQANTTNGDKMQETCVTVTLMKFFWQLHLLTGNPKYADAFEISFYNAYLGSINTEKVVEPSIAKNYPDLCLEPLPFDSYSPLTKGTRGVMIGGFRVMADNHYYGCCACIGSAGIGLVPKMQMLTTKKGFALNLYINGDVKTKTPSGNNVEFLVKTEYPKFGDILIEVNPETTETFELKLRNPYWSKNTKVLVNGKEISVSEGYIVIEKEWVKGDKIVLSLDMRTKALYPVPYGSAILMNKVVWGGNYMISTFDKEDPIAKNHIALMRGPVMLAQDTRLGFDLSKPCNILVGEDGYVDVVLTEKENIPYSHTVGALVPLKDGTFMTVTDYASAGKLWNELSEMAVWMLDK